MRAANEMAKGRKIWRLFKALDDRFLFVIHKVFSQRSVFEQGDLKKPLGLNQFEISSKQKNIKTQLYSKTFHTLH